jgi:hypothetical protein
MRRFAIRLGIPLAALLVASQFLLPRYLEGRVADRITAHGGSAKVDLDALPALRLLFRHGSRLGITARGLSVDLRPNQRDAFKQLDGFSHVNITVLDSRAGPLTVRGFRIARVASHTYDVAIAGDGTARDVASYAGSRLGGGFGQALAGLATSALGGFDRPIPFDARMQIVTAEGTLQARSVRGDVAGLPADALVQVVANALLSAL